MLKLPQQAQHIIKTLAGAGYEAYAVGGSVRDLLLGKSTNGWDFTTNATPAHILNLFTDSFYDNNFGTVGIPQKDEHGKTTDLYEVTTYRTEKGYTDKRHPDQIVWGETLADDLSRRDLTINAIAANGTEIIDPYAGQADLERKIIRTVGDPHQRFAEDALRLMRAVRIATELGFTIEPGTFQAIQTYAQLITTVSSDRIRMELMKILSSTHPADGIMLLRNAGLLIHILPELEKAFSVDQKSPNRHHIYDVGTHSVMALHHCPATDPLVRLATLLHDIGKPIVFHKDPQSGMITFYNHEVIGASIVNNIAYRLNFSKKDREKLVTLVRWHQFTVDEQQTDATLRRFIRRVGKEYIPDMLNLRIGDRLGGGAQETSWRLRLFMKRLEEVQKQPFTVADLKIDGHDVMEILHVGPGPTVGQTLNQLFDHVITNRIPNTREALLKDLKQLSAG
jgi:putative nucleotidyltransferase with HDIG domain